MYISKYNALAIILQHLKYINSIIGIASVF